MTFGESLSRSIKKQIGNQPESLINSASRWVDRTFGEAEASIIEFVQNGIRPDSLQNKVNLAETIVHTPDYLLIKAINTKKTKDESQDVALQRVTGQVSRLFEALAETTKAHTEDIRSETTKMLYERPQVIFNNLLKNATSLEEGIVPPKIRLAKALISSDIVDKHRLIIDVTAQDQNHSLSDNIRNAIKIGFTRRIQGAMSGQSALSNKAKAGIKEYGDLKTQLNNVEKTAEMPTKALEIVLEAIPDGIQGAMSGQSALSNKAKAGIKEYGDLKTMCIKIFGEKFSMPETAMKLVEPFRLAV
ncbi:hypothetical protein KBC75_04685 [Candidatus Shapirobacteria bacterium]|nr:hypothetical protein [Candidatus Shapirobacteria bacterium]